ncbi:MAG: hypothetical protein AB7W59_26850 [Acidimicrobiia bacterium]
MTDEHEQPASTDQGRAAAPDGTEPEPVPVEAAPEVAGPPEEPGRPEATGRLEASAEELRRPDPGGLLGPEIDPGEQSAG